MPFGSEVTEELFDMLFAQRLRVPHLVENYIALDPVHVRFLGLIRVICTAHMQPYLVSELFRSSRNAMAYVAFVFQRNGEAVSF